MQLISEPAASGESRAGKASKALLPRSAAGEPLHDEVEASLDLVRPAVQEDGGDVELVDVADGVVRIRFKGACIGCPSSGMTLRYGIEKQLVEQVEGVRQVVAVE